MKDELINEQDLDSTLKEKISSMTEVPLSTFRRLTESFGFNFGPCYSLMRRIWRQGNSALCMLDMDGPFVPEITQYVIHPAFVDACFQVCSLQMRRQSTVFPLLSFLGAYFFSVLLNWGILERRID